MSFRLLRTSAPGTSNGHVKVAIDNRAVAGLVAPIPRRDGRKEHVLLYDPSQLEDGAVPLRIFACDDPYNRVPAEEMKGESLVALQLRPAHEVQLSYGESLWQMPMSEEAEQSERGSESGSISAGGDAAGD